MIGKGKAISHTGASMAYGWEQEKNAQVIFRQHVYGETPGEIQKEFQFVQNLNSNCQKNTLSFVLSPTMENGASLKAEKLEQICKKFMRQMNLGERQAIGFVHRDKPHKHIHLYVNRVDFKGVAFNDSFIGKHSQLAAEKVAGELGLTTVKEVQRENARGLLEIRYEIKRRHDLVMSGRQGTFKDYMEAMGKRGVRVIPVINKADKLQGFRFQFRNHNLKGSEIHRSMSMGNIGKELAAGRGNHGFIKKDLSVSLVERSVQLSSNIAMRITRSMVRTIIDHGLGY